MLALSLLLHYSCVKSPCDAIQKRSNFLRSTAQTSMTSFLTLLLSQPKIDRNALRLAIDTANEIPTEPNSPTPLNTSERPKLSLSTNSSPGNTLDQTSPQRRPLNTPASADRSPWSANSNQCSTPRTKMMDDWNSENRQLRAQINTERDERQFLEGQLKQHEERISKLSKFFLFFIITIINTLFKMLFFYLKVQKQLWFSK